MSLKDVSRLIEGGAMPIGVKARYSTPVLSSYGSIAELTRSGAVTGIENANGTGPGGSCASGNPNGTKRTCV